MATEYKDLNSKVILRNWTAENMQFLIYSTQTDQDGHHSFFCVVLQDCCQMKQIIFFLNLQLTRKLIYSDQAIPHSRLLR